MKLKLNAVNKVVGKMGKRGLRVRQIAPDIAVFVSVGAIIAGTVMACKATLAAEDIIDNAKKELDDIERSFEENPEEYPPEDKKKYVTAVYVKAGLGFAKAYGPAVAMVSAGTFGVFKSHKTLKDRNLALAAAYGVLDRSFTSYRDRVKEELGDKLDLHFLHGAEDVTIEEKIVDEETGKEKKHKVKGVAIPSDASLYGRWFDKSCTQWENNKDYNLLFLKRAEEFFNNRFNARGYVFLNEIYDYLGIPMTPEGQCVGWLKGFGDDYIDFRIWDNMYADVEDRGGYYVVRKLPKDDSVFENDIFLDFNVSGPILESI